MPIAIPTPDRVTLRYASDANALTGHTDELKLLELSPEVLRLIEQAGEEEPLSLTIKGRPGDDAVICTPTSTFLLRNITVSNSLLIFKPSPSVSSSEDSDGPEDELVRNKLSGVTSLDLSSTCTDILEMIPTFPRLDRIQRVLKESSWGCIEASPVAEPIGDLDGGSKDARRGRKRKLSPGRAGDHRPSKKFTLPQLRSLVQASDAELLSGLRARNVILLPSTSSSSSQQTLLHLPHEHLSPLLSVLLSLVVIHKIGPAKHETLDVDASAVINALGAGAVAGEALEEGFVRGVMRLFGVVQVDEEKEGKELWKADVVGMVREMGKGLLSRLSKVDPPAQDSFIDDWTAQVGGSFDDLVDMKMLEGEYLLQPPTLGSPSPLILPFPLSSLPSDPTARFSDLFLTRPRWRPDEMRPFLRGLTVDGDQKGMDKLVAKYVRAVKEKEGVWWYPRRLG